MSKPIDKKKIDVYQMVTDRMIQALQGGTVPWRKPWKTLGGPRNLNSKKSYRGVNAFLLSLMDYDSPFWMTYEGAKKAGGNVKKGEKGTIVVFWNITQKREWDDEENAFVTKKRPFLRYYRVWNLDQTENVTVPASKQDEAIEFEPIDAAQEIIDNMPDAPEITHGGDRAYYRPSEDSVKLPKQERFETPENYYCTAFHELAHATGHESRLARKNWKAEAFDSESYSKEELVAEMTAAMLMGTIGIEATFDNSASYIGNWLSKLQDDKKLVVQAAAQAQKAADFIQNINHEQESTETPAKELVNA